MNRRAFPTSNDPERESSAASSLAVFVTCAQLMLDQATPEGQRRQAETRLLSQLPVLRALGVFELFSVRDAALAALLEDEFALLDEAKSVAGSRPAGQEDVASKSM